MVVSVGFGVVDERVTRSPASGIADVANSRLLWALWPLVVGLGVGGIAPGAVAGAIGTPLALLGFYLVHGQGLGNAVNGVNSLMGVALAGGAVAGAVGGAIRRVISRRNR